MKQLSSDLREFIHLLNTKNVRYVIVGAWALAFHGRPRYPGDPDIFVARDPDNADRLMTVIDTISRAHLIRNKQAAGRDKDLGDIKLWERTKPSRR